MFLTRARAKSFRRFSISATAHLSEKTTFWFSVMIGTIRCGSEA